MWSDIFRIFGNEKNTVLEMRSRVCLTSPKRGISFYISEEVLLIHSLLLYMNLFLMMFQIAISSVTYCGLKQFFEKKKLVCYSSFHSFYAEYFHISSKYSAFSYFRLRSNLLYFWPNKSYFLCWTHLVIHQSLPFVMQWIHSPCR